MTYYRLGNKLLDLECIRNLSLFSSEKKIQVWFKCGDPDPEILTFGTPEDAEREFNNLNYRLITRLRSK